MRVEPWQRKLARRYPHSAMGRWVRDRESKLRQRLSREHPDLSESALDALCEQQPFLDAIDTILERDKVAFGEAMARASVEQPEAYKAYERATGRAS